MGGAKPHLPKAWEGWWVAISRLHPSSQFFKKPEKIFQKILSSAFINFLKFFKKN